MHDLASPSNNTFSAASFHSERVMKKINGARYEGTQWHHLLSENAHAPLWKLQPDTLRATLIQIVQLTSMRWLPLVHIISPAISQMFAVIFSKIMVVSNKPFSAKSLPPYSWIITVISCVTTQVLGS